MKRGNAPAHRGFPEPAGGFDRYLPTPREWRATTVQACGLWPFVGGSGSPLIGVPLGRHLISHGTVCCDPISWFRHQLISSPGMFVLGGLGLGKSTLLRRMLLGTAGFGIRPLVLGDLKPDYADLVHALGGQVITLGRGHDTLNPLDAGAMGQAADRIGGPRGEQLRAEIHGRQLNMVAALISILRGPTRPVTAEESTILSTALRVLHARTASDQEPVLGDLVEVLTQAPDELRAVVLDRGDDARYNDAIDPLHKVLLGLQDGALGDVFAKPTSTAIDLDAPAVCMDLSRIAQSDTALQAAALISTWSAGFAAVGGAQALADAGLEQQRNYFVFMDELWRVLRAGGGLVDRVDAITRLDRNEGYGKALCTHTLSDLEALPNPEDRAKARGLAERCAITVAGGLPRNEIDDLRGIVHVSGEEASRITAWNDPAPVDPSTGVTGRPPGRGKFLIKAGQKPGIPLEVVLTERERALNDTNQRWHMAGNLQ